MAAIDMYARGGIVPRTMRGKAIVNPPGLPQQAPAKPILGPAYAAETARIANGYAAKNKLDQGKFAVRQGEVDSARGNLTQMQNTYNAGAGARGMAVDALGGGYGSGLTPPSNSSKTPIMSASQSRMLSQRGLSGYVPPRDEGSTISDVDGIWDRTRQATNGTGALPGGSLVVAGKNGLPGLAPHTNRAYAGADGHFDREKFEAANPQMRVNRLAAEQKAVGSRMSARQGNALRALSYMDPMMYSQMGAGLGGFNPMAQQQMQGMLRSNSQIPWVRQALGMSSKDRVDPQRALLQAKYNQLRDARDQLKLKYEGRWLGDMTNAVPNQIAEHDRQLAELEKQLAIADPSANVAPRTLSANPPIPLATQPNINSLHKFIFGDPEAFRRMYRIQK